MEQLLYMIWAIQLSIEEFISPKLSHFSSFNPVRSIFTGRNLEKDLQHYRFGPD